MYSLLQNHNLLIKDTINRTSTINQNQHTITNHNKLTINFNLLRLSTNQVKTQTFMNTYLKSLAITGLFALTCLSCTEAENPKGEFDSNIGETSLEEAPRAAEPNHEREHDIDSDNHYGDTTTAKE